MELFIYLLKVTGCTAAFYLVYYTLFRKLTFFSLNRWYLLASLLVSMLIPLLHISVQTTIPTPDVKPVIINTATKTIEFVADPVILQQPLVQHINWESIAVYAYWIIAALLLIKLTITLGGIIYKGIKHGKRQNGYRLVNGIPANNSSFFNYIFLNDNHLDIIEQEQVITHELVHAKLMHSADNLFTEVLKALLWFNPFVYLYSKALHQAHEFEVDSHLADRYNSKNYASLLLKLSMPANVGISNQFSAYGLKSRVQMLFKSKSATAKKLGYLLMLPIIASLVYFLAVDKVYAYSEDTSLNKNFVLVLDAGHDGKSGAGVGSVLESDIALTMVKQIKAIAEERGIKTVLTRTDNTAVPLAERKSVQGDAFVSVHVNAVSGEMPASATGMMVVTDRNPKPETQKLATALIGEMQKLNGITMSDKVYHQGVGVLRDNKTPAILIELGYLTNKNDLKYITDPQNQHNIAQKFVDAILAYKKAAQPKNSGAIVKPDTGLHVKVNVAFVPHTWGKAQPAQTVTDTVKNARGKSISDTHKSTSLNISCSADDLKAGEVNLYADFSHVRIISSDSSASKRNGDVVIYNANLVTGKFNIKAKTVRYNLSDSIVSASGKVHITITDNNMVQKPYSTSMVIDTLTIDLKNHPKKKI
ncbi:MAG: N-acetylmuramoyl-L-alanine amidase [Mucilaginibacter sp.]|uniref:N-acetylmuramoyl-L-alanine amidase n=1 Tax=Mucilaginibacter sp. TaxID=1882438 RepID=UPI003266412D